MKEKLEAVQALRFVAATAVVVDHALGQLVRHGLLAPRWEQFGWQCGMIGVWTFFVISGFIMIHAERAHFGQTGGAAAFFLKRLIRIAPMYWLATLAQIAAVVAAGRELPSASYVISSMLFIPTPVALGEVVRPLLGQGWTLIYEMMFYLLFFFAMFAAFGRGLAALVGALAAIALLGVFIKPLSAAYDPYTIAMFLSDPIILLFGVGCVIAVVRYRHDKIGFDHALPAALIVLGVAATIFVAGGFAYPMNFYARALFALFAAIAVAVCSFGRDRSSPSRRLLTTLGDASYSVYLFHLLFLNALFILAARLPGFSHYALLYVVLAAVVANLAGLLIHFFIEKPLTAHLRAIALRGSHRAETRVLAKG